MLMEIRQLRYFIAVAEERNFTRAADRLHIAQPPLSRQIQQLEAELGVELIDRAARPLLLTTAGSLFYEQAKQVLGRLVDMQMMLKRAGAVEQRRFVIGFVASTIYARLPQLIRGFRRAAPMVDLVLVEMVSLEQILALKEHRIDVGFGRIGFDDKAVRRTVLRNEKLIVALPATHALAGSDGPLALDELANTPLILYPREPRPSYADQVLKVFYDAGLSPTIAHEVRELQIAIGLVAAEEGVAIVPDSVRRVRVGDVEYREISAAAVSPIIMNHRIDDRSPELLTMASVIAEHYEVWGYDVPHALSALLTESG